MTPEFGVLDWRDDKQQCITAKVDMAALEGTSLRMISVVGSLHNLKSMRASLANGGADWAMTIKAVWDGASQEESKQAFPAKGGYHLSSHRLGYDQVHAVFWSRATGLLFDDSDAALWLALKSKRFTTPLLRGWLPHIKEQMIEKELIVPCSNTGGSKCRVLRGGTAQLDAIVSQGIKTGILKIREDAA
jgi:hypothetical protein